MPPNRPAALMEYLLLVYQDEGEADSRSSQEQNGILERCLEHSRQLQRAGVFMGGAPLKLSREAKTLRVRDGGALVTEGSAAAAGRTLGWYFRLRCASRQEAIEHAADILRRQSNYRGAIEIHALHD